MIHLVRHGQTAGNASRVFQLPETPLSELGDAQARALGARFRGESVAAVLASDYSRAEATARRVAEATGAPLTLEPALRERSFGELRGTAYAALDFDPFAPDYEPPGGESWPAFHARVDEAWRIVQAAALGAGGTLVVVTHGLVCLSLADRHLTLPRDLAIAATGLANTSVTTVEPRPPFRVTTLACTVHLGEEPEAGAPA